MVPVRSRRRSVVAAIFAAALAWSGAAAAAKDELVIGVGQFPTSFHPNLASHVVLSLIHGMTRRPFAVYDADWKIVCLLCTELPSRAAGSARDWTTDDGRPGLAVDYSIRADATWGDGTPVSTKDVLFTWEIGREPTSGVVGRSVYEDIEKIVVVDAKRFTVHLNKRTCDFEGAAGFEVVPAHLERPTAVEPASYRTRNAYDTDTTNPGLYFGPYRIVRVEPGAFVVLERNPTWWGKPARFKRVTVRTIENTAALEANLLSGEIDYIAGEDGISLDQALEFEKRHGDDFRVVFKQGLFYEHIDLNLDNPILADVRVRRALVHALDREAISTRLFAGRQPVADTSVNPLDTVYDAGVRKYAYDPAAAKRLLDEAGWTERRGGIRHNAAGQRLTLEIMSTRRQPGARTGRTGAAELLARCRRRRADQERAGARAVRPDHPATPVRGDGDVRVVLLAAQHPQIGIAFDAHPDRGQRLVGPELHRLSQRRDGRDDRPAGSRMRRGGTDRAVESPAAHLRRGFTGDPALLPRQRLRHATLADRHPPDRPPVPDDAVGRGLGRRVTPRDTAN